MVMLSILQVDQRVFDLVSIASAVSGVLGSLFFAYDLLGRPGGFLRGLLRVVVPALLGGLLVGALFSVVFYFDGILAVPRYAHRVLSALLLGVLLGIYYGLFVDDPDAPYQPRFHFSVRDAVVGLVVAAGFSALYLAVNRTTNVVPILVAAIAAGGVAGGVLAGSWRAANHPRSAAGVRPHLISRPGTLIGIIAGFVLVAAILLATSLPTRGASVTTVSSAVVLAGVIGMPAGGITGTFTPYVFWRVNTMREHGMEVLGLVLILLAFLLQVLEPIAHLVPS